MNAATKTRRHPIDAFIEQQRRCRELLAELTERVEDHNGVDPDTLHWGNVGDMEHIASVLEELSP